MFRLVVCSWLLFYSVYIVASFVYISSDQSSVPIIT